MEDNEILYYLKKKFREMLELEEKRVFPDNNAITDVFNIVNNYCNSGDRKCEVLYALFKSCITDCINESICLLNRYELCKKLSLISLPIIESSDNNSVLP